MTSFRSIALACTFFVLSAVVADAATLSASVTVYSGPGREFRALGTLPAGKVNLGECRFNNRDESWCAVALTEQLGDSALVTVVDPGDSEPASFLLVKGEAGWRIRDYVWR